LFSGQCAQSPLFLFASILLSLHKAIYFSKKPQPHKRSPASAFSPFPRTFLFFRTFSPRRVEEGHFVVNFFSSLDRDTIFSPRCGSFPSHQIVSFSRNLQCFRPCDFPRPPFFHDGMAFWLPMTRLHDSPFYGFPRFCAESSFSLPPSCCWLRLTPAPLDGQIFFWQRSINPLPPPWIL